jgi:predicted amidohydrolase
MTTTVRAACIQLTPGNDLAENLRAITGLVGRTVAAGAGLVAIPEFATYLDRSSASMRSSASTQESSKALAELRGLAKDNRVWLLVGSIVVLQEGQGDGRLLNRSFLVSPGGAICGHYDKIHLFDARLSDGRVVGESKHYAGGESAPVIRTPFGKVGMTICYDLRFPELYRRLALAGADILSIPAAFTAETGRAHWEPLLRARAIENGCYVLAPATCGTHPGDWKTHGHAAIVDPWGEIVAQCDGLEQGFAIADLDLKRVGEARARIPSLNTNPTYAVAECLAATN